MIKYTYGFDNLNKSNMWIESDNEETIDVVVDNQNTINLSDYDVIFGEELNSEENKENVPDYETNENVMPKNDEVIRNQRTIRRKIRRYGRSNMLFNNKYFSVISKSDKGIHAKCCRCQNILKGYGSSTSNFISHLKAVNP